MLHYLSLTVTNMIQFSSTASIMSSFFSTVAVFFSRQSKNGKTVVLKKKKKGSQSNNQFNLFWNLCHLLHFKPYLMNLEQETT